MSDEKFLPWGLKSKSLAPGSMKVCYISRAETKYKRLNYS